MKAGWEEKPLREVCELRPQKRQAKEKLTDADDVSFVPMKCLNSGSRDLSAHQTEPLSKVYSGYTYFAENDVLLAKITPCFENGKLGVARNLVNGIGFGSSEFFVLRPGEGILPDFLYYFLDQQSFRNSAEKVMGGAVGHKRVPKEFVQDLSIPIPPLEEQRRIVAVLDEVFEGLDRARKNTETNLTNARELFERALTCLLYTSPSPRDRG